MNLPESDLRPREFALLLLASGESAPRKRARDQQADMVGLDLKRRILADLVAIDPEPEELEAALMELVESIGPPTGPTRSVASTLLEEYAMARQSPEWIASLLDEAIEPPKGEGRRRGRQLPG